MMSKSPLADAPAAAIPRISWYKRRWVLFLAFAPIVPLGAAGVALIFITTTATRAHREAVAETDKLDPRWQLEDIEAGRAAVPDGENSALVVKSAFGATSGLPVYPTARPRPEDAPQATPVFANDLVSALPANRIVPPELLEEFAQGLEPYAAPLEVARGLAGMRRGRTPIKIPANPMMLMLGHVQNSRYVARLLHDDAILKAQQGDIDAAILDARAGLGLAAAIGDEPFAISMLVRIAEDSVAIDAASRALAMGVADDAALASLDDDLAFEEAQPLLKLALRGERGAAYGNLDQVAIGALPGFVPGAPSPDPLSNLFVLAAKRGPHVRAWYRYNQAVSLRQMNEALAIADRPSFEQSEPWVAWEARYRIPGLKVEGLVIAPSTYVSSMARNIAATYARNLAMLRSARAMVAMERFRMARGRWPAEGEIAMPVDPLDGQPLRRKRLDDGWVIYSVGQDLVDDGGSIDRKVKNRMPSDVGLTLHDPEARRLPPLEPASEPSS